VSLNQLGGLALKHLAWSREAKQMGPSIFRADQGFDQPESMQIGHWSLERLTGNAHKCLDVNRFAVRVSSYIKEHLVMASPKPLHREQRICLLNDPAKRLVKSNDQRIDINRWHG
jgi:hypothetical protein